MEESAIIVASRGIIFIMQNSRSGRKLQFLIRVHLELDSSSLSIIALASTPRRDRTARAERFISMIT